MSNILPLNALLVNNNISEELTPFAPAMMNIQDEVAERVNIPRPEKVDNTGYGFFPTGGQNMFGVESLDLPDKWVTGLGLLAGVGLDGGKRAASKVAGKVVNSKIAKLARKLKGGPGRDTPAGKENVVKFLTEIQKVPGASPGKKELANNLIDVLEHGTPFKYVQDPTVKKVIGRIKANTEDVVPVAPGVQLRQELSMNPYTNTVGRMNYVHFDKTPMIDVDLPVGQSSHMAAQMSHGMKSYSDFMKRLHKFLYSSKGKDSQFRLYKTQGGYRLFDTSKRWNPRQYTSPLRWPDEQPVAKILGQDRFYTNAITSRNQYSARLTPKPGRVGDYVTDFKGTYGYGTPIQQNVDEVVNYHDNYIVIVNKRMAMGDPRGLGGLFELIKKMK